MAIAILALTVSVLSLIASICSYRHTVRRWREHEADQEVIAAIRKGAHSGMCRAIYARHGVTREIEDRIAYYMLRYTTMGGA